MPEPTGTENLIVTATPDGFVARWFTVNDHFAAREAFITDDPDRLGAHIAAWARAQQPPAPTPSPRHRPETLERRCSEPPSLYGDPHMD